MDLPAGAGVALLARMTGVPSHEALYVDERPRHRPDCLLPVGVQERAADAAIRHPDRAPPARQLEMDRFHVGVRDVRPTRIDRVRRRVAVGAVGPRLSVRPREFEPVDLDEGDIRVDLRGNGLSLTLALGADEVVEEASTGLGGTATRSDPVAEYTLDARHYGQAVDVRIPARGGSRWLGRGISLVDHHPARAGTGENRRTDAHREQQQQHERRSEKSLLLLHCSLPPSSADLQMPMPDSGF